MSPLMRGYYLGAEESAPLFKMNSSGGNWIIGMIWTQIWVFLMDIRPFFLIWTTTSLAAGMLLYIVWLSILKIRYGNPLDDPEIAEIVERARAKIGFRDEVQIWLRKSDKLICMAAKTPLFTSLLLSNIAVQDMMVNPESSEIIVAYKLAKIRKNTPFKQFMESGVYFMIGVIWAAFMFIDITDVISPISNATVFMALMIGGLAAAIVIFGVFILSRSYKDEEFEAVESLYNIPPVVAFMRVFGKDTVSEEKLTEYFEIAKPKIKDELSQEKTNRFRNAAVISIITLVSVILFMLVIGVFGSPIRTVMSLMFALLFGGIAFLFTIIFYSMRDIWRPRKDNDEETDERTYHGSLSSVIEDMMHHVARLDGYYVRLIETSHGHDYLAIFNSRILVPSNVVFSVPSSIMELLKTPDMLTPYIVYEIKYSKLTSKYQKYPAILMFGALPFYIIYMFQNIFSGGDILAAFGCYFAWIFLVATVGYVLFRLKSFSLDLELARRFPQHVNMLYKLLDAGFATPYMGHPIKKRLKFLERKGFTHDPGLLE